MTRLMKAHMQYMPPSWIAHVCEYYSSSLYALKTLQGHGMPVQALYDVTARLVYAYPPWWGFLSKGDRERKQWLVRRV